MTVKFLREVLKHYEDKEYDDWKIELFDYNNQRSLEVLDGTYASSKESKIISFPVKVELMASPSTKGLSQLLKKMDTLKPLTATECQIVGIQYLTLIRYFEQKILETVSIKQSDIDKLQKCFNIINDNDIDYGIKED